MGKKKGGAKNKLAKMSEEERARYLQHRADMEEEARRRKQQLIALYMKNKLKREEAFSRLNLAKINQEWRSILRQIKCQELKNEITQVIQLFTISLEQKNRIIYRLISDLDEAEDLYSTLQISHIQNIEKILEIQGGRMKFYKEEYSKNKNILLKECKEDFQCYKNSREETQEELECVYFELEDQVVEHKKFFNEDHIDKMNDLKSKMAIKLEAVTMVCEAELTELWNEYQQVLDNYMNSIELFHAEYSDLRNRDEENTKLIQTHCYEVERATDLIVNLKLDADSTVEEYQFRLKYLRKYKKDINDNFVGLKRCLEDILKHDKTQFQYMAAQGYEIIQVLKKKKQRAESILQLGASCRRLESEKEKIFPPYLIANQDHLMTKYLTSSSDSDMKKFPVEMWVNLENLWIRVNSARLDTACLEEEKRILEKQNAEWKTNIKDYLTKVTMSSGTNPNTDIMLAQRPTSMKVEKVVHIDLKSQEQILKKKKGHKKRPVTCIEGNLSNAVRSIKLIEGKLNTANFHFTKF